MAEGDATKTLMYGLFIGCFLAAGAFSTAFLIELIALSVLERIDAGVILLFIAGICLVIGFVLDGIHTSRTVRRKNVITHQKMLALKEEQKKAQEAGLQRRGSKLFKSGFSTPEVMEDIEDYSEKFSLNKGMVLLLAGLIDFFFLIAFVLLW